jgi:hypothetical protein
MPVILATQKAETRRMEAQSLGKPFWRPYFKNAQHKKGLVEWLKW